MSDHSHQLTELDELVLWTRRFHGMLQAGVSLLRCLRALQEDATSEQMADVSSQLRQIVWDGHPLSKAMMNLVEYFSFEYAATIRVGEIGGVVEDSLARIIDLHKKSLFPTPEPVPGVITRTELMQWCWKLSSLLSYQISLPDALDKCARLSQGTLKEITLRLQERLDGGDGFSDALGEEGVFPTMMVQMVEVGEVENELDIRLAEVSAHLEYEALLEREGKLPPYSVEEESEV